MSSLPQQTIESEGRAVHLQHHEGLLTLRRVLAGLVAGEAASDESTFLARPFLTTGESDAKDFTASATALGVLWILGLNCRTLAVIQTPQPGKLTQALHAHKALILHRPASSALPYGIGLT